MILHQNNSDKENHQAEMLILFFRPVICPAEYFQVIVSIVYNILLMYKM